MSLLLAPSVRREGKRLLLQAKAWTATWRAGAHDTRRFLTYSSTLGVSRSHANLAAKITERYHNLEKGLSLPDPRPGFGAEGAGTLIRLVQTYLDEVGHDEVTAAAVAALREYAAFNSATMGSDGPHHEQILRLVKSVDVSATRPAGARWMRREEVAKATESVSLDFFTSRHSTRMFDPRPPDPAAVDVAVRAADTAPAVCNRQFGRVRVWTNSSDVARLLAVQGGARGFAENVPAVAMLSVSLRSYWGGEERNQGWIDGGLFAMAFLLGLHAAGFGAVPLNWSKLPSTDRAMRALVPDIDESESIIMLVAFGHLRDEYRVAASPRVSGRYQGFNASPLAQ